MVEVEALRMQHWLMWKPGGSNEVVGCHCGFAADVEADSGYGDSVVVHFFEVAAAAVRAEVVADERRRIVRDIIALAPVNCELRPDGKEDPIFAAWVEGVGDSARVARGRSE